MKWDLRKVKETIIEPIGGMLFFISMGIVWF